MSWKEDQQWESEWHGNCVNSFWEETKQIVYAKRMGLEADMVLGKYPVYDLKGKSVIDIGGGAYSMLLKTVNGKRLTVVDPCFYPKWTKDRYSANRIQFINSPAEEIRELEGHEFDEVWIYNCLQHTIDPKKILKNALVLSKVVRIFEWIDTGVAIGHPQDLKEDKLNKWLGGVGKTEVLNESGCYGKCYYGIFKGKHYEN